MAATEAYAHDGQVERPVAYCYAILKTGEKVRQHRQKAQAQDVAKSAEQAVEERAAMMRGITAGLLRQWPEDQTLAILLDQYGRAEETVREARLCIKQALAGQE